MDNAIGSLPSCLVIALEIADGLMLQKERDFCMAAKLLDHLESQETEDSVAAGMAGMLHDWMGGTERETRLIDTLGAAKESLGLAWPPMEVAKALAGKPGPTMESTEGATNRYDLVCSLSCDISYLNNLLNMVEERVGKGRDGALFSLLEAVMPRMKQALETVEKLELAA